MTPNWNALWKRLAGQPAGAVSTHAIRDYRKLVRRKLREHPGNRPLALAQSVGSHDMDNFHLWGEIHLAVLRHHGLADGMSIYDLGCGCGRTAQALRRAGWQGTYKGADIIPELVAEVGRACPGYEAVVNPRLTIAAPDASLDMLFHWSVFTHLYPEEGYIYMLDIFRALKPGGRLVFSFLELGDPNQERIFDKKVYNMMHGRYISHLDQFLHRDWISAFARKIGFEQPAFTDGADATHHPAFGQSLVVMAKPLA
ncbi:MAG: class I SAM-dependent methyltransferase [Sphingomonadales bacterium]|nr:class I SAM-dependent methyltransferase [Sphingomonadales bacterium]